MSSHFALSWEENPILKSFMTLIWLQFRNSLLVQGYLTSKEKDIVHNSANPYTSLKRNTGDPEGRLGFINLAFLQRET